MNPPSAASAVDPQVPAPLPEALPSSGLPHEGMPAPASGPARMRPVAETGCAATRRWLRGDWTPEWFCAFLAGNRREQGRFRQELATMRGSVAWLLRQRRQGRWSAEERERLRGLMRSASSVSPLSADLGGAGIDAAAAVHGVVHRLAPFGGRKGTGSSNATRRRSGHSYRTGLTAGQRCRSTYQE